MKRDKETGVRGGASALGANSELRFGALLVVGVLILVMNLGLYVQYWINSDSSFADSGTDGVSVAKIKEESDTANSLKTIEKAAELHSSINSSPPEDQDFVDKKFTFAAGDTLHKALVASGIQHNTAHLIAKAANKVYSLSRLQIGEEVRVVYQHLSRNGDDVVLARANNICIMLGKTSINVQLDKKQHVYRAFINQGNPYKKESKIDIIEAVKKHSLASSSKYKTTNVVANGRRFVKGVIKTSFSSAARSAKIPNEIVHSYVRLFSYSVDFQRAIKPKMSFKILYDQKTKQILYASLGKVEIYGYKARGSGGHNYFHPDGTSIEKAILKTPINGARISSRFGVRMHPILGYSRMHRGLDYAAPSGTPILAAGSGVIKTAQYERGGYGYHVKIQHDTKYSTLYAHLSRFAKNVKIGSKVNQGQVIGYVGTSGMSSGPHLHFELHENRHQVNPLKTVVTQTKRVAPTQMLAFNTQRRTINSMINKEEKIILTAQKSK